jgi:S1-C subfamily serine protease
MLSLAALGRCLTAAILLAAAPALATAKPLSAMNDMMERGTIAPMLEKVIPSVVSIRIKGVEAVQQNPLYGHPVFGKLVAQESAGPQSREFTSSGSGVIVDAERGIILTNFHVIEKAKEIKVRLNDGREILAQLVGQDPATDVAAIHIDSKNITAMRIGDSDEVKVGDFVVAIGNPLGLDFTATMGMVSALARSTVGYRNFESFIQHDAAVNSGNSGGALINMKGELVGINTAIRSPSGGSVGLGFAIPANMAWYVMEQLVKYGKVRRGISGLKLEDVTPDDVARLDLGVSQGAIVKGVQKGSPADEQGFKINDVITGVNQYTIRRAADYRALEAVAEVGAKGTVHVHRNGKLDYIALWIADIPPEQE